MDPLHWIDEQLDQLRQQDLQRQLPAPLGAVGPTCCAQGQPLLNFASNDYLGLAADPRLVEAAAHSLKQDGWGRGSSPLISGRSHQHHALEQQLAAWEGTEAALLFASGFAANAGTIPALTGADDAIYSDAHNHASIVDGCRLSHAQKQIYPHGDVAALERMLQAGGAYRRRLIVTDTLFSMDGDLAPLPALGALAEKYDAMLMVDEAHATGVFGAEGRGVVEHFSAEYPRLHDQVQVRVGTLSKALGSAGGFVCGSQALVDWLANRARSYVFSTAQPAAASAAARVALRIVADEPERRRQLLESAAQLRQQLQQLGWDTGPSASQIIPLTVGAADRTMQLAQQLRALGCWIPGIRPPSVPDGQSRLRLSLSTAHDPSRLAQVVEALATAGPA
jgi:8-amino-7-oxononanoate synthase